MPTENRSSNTEQMVSVPLKLTEQQARDIQRFYDTCEDGQGYDVPKDRMKSLARLGLTRSLGFGRYELTDAGDASVNELRAHSAAQHQDYPTEGELIASGLGYPIGKEDAVKLHYAGYRSEVITILEAWEAIGHDIHINPDKQELIESLRNMAAICAAHGFDMPAAQHQVEPVLIQAVAVTRADDEDGLRLEWLLEGGIAEMEFPGQVLFAMAEANDLCDEDGSGHVYLTPPAQQQGELDRLRASEDKWYQGSVNLTVERDVLSAQLTKQAALLREANGLLKASAERLPRKHQTIRAHIDHLRSVVETALSASAESTPFPGYPPVPEDRKLPTEPSAPVERDHEIPGTSFQRLNDLASQGE